MCETEGNDLIEGTDYSRVNVPNGDLYELKPKPDNNGPLVGKTICLDAGHQGHDSGASYLNGVVVESQLNRYNTIRLAKQLRDQGATVVINVDPHKTSREQSYENSGVRDTMFNSYMQLRNISSDKAVMMSIHSNDADNKNATRLEVLYRGDGSQGILGSMKGVKIGERDLKVGHTTQARGSAIFSNFAGNHSVLVECGFPKDIFYMIKDGGYNDLHNKFLSVVASNLAK